MCSHLQPRTWAAIGLVVALAAGSRLRAQTNFVIEAEDYNYASGQTTAIASIMPYLGGASAGLTGVPEVDYHRTPDASSPAYRNDNNVPIAANSPDIDRDQWTVTSNYRLGWIGDGYWFNYTRTFPTGYYRVYAALSYGSTDAHVLRGTLQQVHGSTSTPNQSTTDLGTFDGSGSGAWGLNSLVPMMDRGGNDATIALGGVNTLRFASGSGDIDYFKFVPLVAPRISLQPTNLNVMENDPAALVVQTANTVTPNFQWQSNRVSIPGATGSTFLMPVTPLSANQTKYRCVVRNLVGTTNSSEVVLTVTPDTIRPYIVRAQNSGQTTLIVVFSEAVASSGALDLAHYSLTPAIHISSIALGADLKTVVLTTAPLTFDSTYTLTVNDVQDRAATPNTIAPNSQVTFAALDYLPTEIGGSSTPGSVRLATAGYDISAQGADIGQTADQCEFAHQTRVGDFDMQVRIESLDLSDLWAKAGLMVRESVAGNSRFVAVLATPGMNGCFMEYRDPSGGNAVSAGSLPANFPDTWLRLQRIGNQFTTFGSYDGLTWTQLGAVTLDLPNTLLFGLAVSSHSAATPTTAKFRDLGVSSGGTIGVARSPLEPLGPCSRRTQLVISEIMYAPAPRSDSLNLAYVEIYNSNPWWEDISGYHIDGDIQFTFPTNTIIKAGAFLVLAAAPADLQGAYAMTNVLGPYLGALKARGTVRLLQDRGAVLLEIPYDSKLPWPAGALGTGHSIALVRPSYGEADPRAWSASDRAGGSPGRAEAFKPGPLHNLVINEFLARPQPGEDGYIELYNHSSNSADISGCVLSATLASGEFVIPTNTVIGAAGFLFFYQTDLGFAPSPAGDVLLLRSPDRSLILDAISFEPPGPDIAVGRWPDGAADVYPLKAHTPGAGNGAILVGNVVINEIMYKPISGNDDDQYVELYNQGTNMVNLGGWQFTSGITFQFPASTLLYPGGYLVVARNLTNLLARYPNLSQGNTVGNFAGKLPHKGGRLALAEPDSVVITIGSGGSTTVPVLVVEDEVTYEVGGRWGQWANGGGSSLELVHPNTNHRLAFNWADSDETAKSAWTNLEVTGLLDNGANYNGGKIDLVQVGLLDVGECLLDNLELHSGASALNLIQNGDFESGASGWVMQGDHSRSSIETAAGLGGYQSAASLHIRSSDSLWLGANSVEGTLTNNTLAPGKIATLRVKGRWLKGSPEVLMRLHGNWLELAKPLPVPSNLGTPGLANSRALERPAPAIFEVKHSPPIPPAGSPIWVTARFHDFHAFTPTLRYRIDSGVNPHPSYTEIVMRDDGGEASGDAVKRDGIYTATIPAQPAGTVIAFIVVARDNSGSIAFFPEDLQDNSGLPRECVVMVGDATPAGSFGHYHVWLTANWLDRWASFPAMSNESNDATFVDGGGRIVYDMVGRFAGSPYHPYSGSPVTTLGGMHWNFPDDDRMLGATSFNKQHVPGNGPLDDNTLQREQTCYWMARQLGLPWDYRRFYILYVNGNRHGPLMEDSQTPGADMLKEYFPNDNNGFLYKNHVWFEFDANGVLFNGFAGCTFNRFTTVVGGARVPKIPSYRWNYWIRQYPDSPNNLTNVIALVNTANLSTASPAYYATMEALVDTEEYMRMSAIEHATGDWDSFITQSSWNMYSYKPLYGKWTLIKWDWNIELGSSGSWGPDGNNLFSLSSGDPRMIAFQTYAPYQRAYLRAFKQIAEGPMNNANIDPILDAKYAAFAANGLAASPFNVQEPGAAGLKSWIKTMHASLTSALTARSVLDVPFAVTTPTNVEIGTNVTTVLGTAPLEVKTVTINGIAYPVTWKTTKIWSVTLPLFQQTNTLSVAGLDLAGRNLTNASAMISVTVTNPIPLPSAPILINEWMANQQNTVADPGDGNFHDWLELYNPNATVVDLTGYTLATDSANLTNWTIPPGTTIPSLGFLLLWAEGNPPLTYSGAFSDLHGSFKLRKGGGYLALRAWDGHVVDSVTYDPQTSDMSQGRYPDGGSDLFFMSTPTPRAANHIPPPPPPALKLLGFTVSADRSTFTLTWAAQPSRVYRIQSTADLAKPAWLDFPNAVTSTSSVAAATFTPPATNVAGYYRVVQLP